jgi:hypothetical protein
MTISDKLEADKQGLIVPDKADPNKVYPVGKPVKPTWKVVAVDNYARETVADKLLAESIPHEHLAKIIADHFNSMRAWGDDRYFRVFPNDYQLSLGMEDLV